jgi:hypothetical protein
VATREGATLRTIREPEDLPRHFHETCGKGFAACLAVCGETLFAFLEG